MRSHFSSLAKGLLISAAALASTSCLMQRTVRDSSGQLIYQEPEWHTPYESEEKKFREVEAKEEQLGW